MATTANLVQGAFLGERKPARMLLYSVDPLIARTVPWDCVQSRESDVMPVTTPLLRDPRERKCNLLPPPLHPCAKHSSANQRVRPKRLLFLPLLSYLLGSSNLLFQFLKIFNLSSNSALSLQTGYEKTWACLPGSI